MLFKPRNVAALQIALAGLPEKMRVESDEDAKVPARTVGELRNVQSWPDNFVVATPHRVDPGSIVRVSKASHATRTSPKP